MTTAFEKRVKALLSQFNVPGITIATFNKTRTVSNGFGLASIDPEIQATADCIFDCASTSKSLTAAAVAKILEQHPELSWKTTVSSILKDDFVLADATATANTTIEDILSHRSGTARHDYSYMGQSSDEPDTPQSVTRNLRNLAMGSPPRTKFHYSNIMFTVAAYLVETVSGQAFPEYIQTHFFTPLAMDSTFFLPSSVFKAGQSHRLARPYTYQPSTSSFKQDPFVEQPEAIGAGLIQTTCVDYAKWVQAVMNRDPALLSSEAWKEYLQPRIACDDGEDEELRPFTSCALYALGWEIDWYRGYRIVSHSGSELGYRALMMFLPKVEFGLVIYGNASEADRIAEALAMDLVDEVLGVPVSERIDWEARQIKKMSEAAASDEQDLKKLREENLEGAEWKQCAPSLPLGKYAGIWSNIGYHKMVVEVKHGQLFIDASDRTMAFTCKFEHIRDDRMFICSMDHGECFEYVKVEFEMDQENNVTRMGIGLCEEILPELIWFDRTTMK